MRGAEVDALAGQLEDLVALVAQLSEADFGRPTRCPGWSVAELVAHCEGMLHRLVGENARPVVGAAEIDRVGYYRYDPDGPREGEDPAQTFSEVIRNRVVEEVGGRSGAELNASIAGAAKWVLRGLHEIEAERVIERSGHPKISFGEFVASRVLEFGVHTMDIADAVGRSERVRRPAAEIITGILDGLLGEPLPSSLRWDATTYILAGTGRRDLDPQDQTELGPLADRFPLLR